MIHLYALTARPSSHGEVTGIDGQPVASVDCGSLQATVSEHARAPSSSRDAALAHAAVVAAVAERGPTLPVRFGTDHPDRDSLRTSVAASADALVAALERVRNGVEFVLRPVAPPVPAVEPAASTASSSGAGGGRAYLEQRLADEQAARTAHEREVRRLQDATAAGLEDRAMAIAERTGRFGPERCFLVSRDDAEGFAAAAVAALADHEGIALGGPWPPYTFAEIGSIA